MGDRVQETAEELRQLKQPRLAQAFLAGVTVHDFTSRPRLQARTRPRTRQPACEQRVCPRETKQAATRAARTQANRHKTRKRLGVLARHACGRARGVGEKAAVAHVGAQMAASDLHPRVRPRPRTKTCLGCDEPPVLGRQRRGGRTGPWGQKPRGTRSSSPARSRAPRGRGPPRTRFPAAARGGPHRPCTATAARARHGRGATCGSRVRGGGGGAAAPRGG